MTYLPTIRRMVRGTKQTKSRTLRNAIDAGDNDLVQLLRLSCDPFLWFGLNKVPEFLEQDDTPGTLTFAQFHRLCRSLQSGEMDADMARHAVLRAAEACDTASWNEIYRPLLLRSLRVIEPTTFNIVVAKVGADGLRLPLFRPQLASSGSGQIIKGARLVEAKIDGARLLAILDRATHLRSAEGIVVDDPAITAALQPLAQRLPAPLVIDGVRMPTGKYVVFDLIPLAEFKLGFCEKSQRHRRTTLINLQQHGAFDTRFVQVIPQVEIDFCPHILNPHLAEFKAQAQAHGHSAIMVKKPLAGYTGRRNSAWIEKTLD